MKELLLCGLSHKTAPVEWRERLNVPEGLLPVFLSELLKGGAVAEAVALSTCNRMEIYAVADDGAPARDFLEGRVVDLYGDASVRPALYARRHEEALRHLFRVAAGLESLVVGEAEILGQVKRSYELGQAAGATGKLTNVVFQRALFLGKKVRAETRLSEGPTSVASVAVALAQRIFGDLKDNRVLLIGAGEMAELAARALISQKIGTLTIVNRTLAKAEDLAKRFGGRAAPFDQILDNVAQADVVLCSTGSPQPVLTRAAIAGVMRRRRGRPLFFIDIAVPRDVEPSAHGLEGVYLYNIDDLQSIVNESRTRRENILTAAETLVEAEAAAFAPWYRAWTQGEKRALRHGPSLEPLSDNE